MPPRSITLIAMTPPSTSIVTTASPKKARIPANVMTEGCQIGDGWHDGASALSRAGDSCIRCAGEPYPGG